jgi:pimeloyl-[acyl-carrier protein] methyl ester esterase
VKADPATTELLAMHGWGCDSRIWKGWAEPVAERGWQLRCGDRGYGSAPAEALAWSASSQRRLLITHSLGTHLLPDAVWHQATRVVLLASFARFVPAERAGRSLRYALKEMGQRLENGQSAAVLHDFQRQCAAPNSAAPRASGWIEPPLTTTGERRLRIDLKQMSRIEALPTAFPIDAQVLIVEAGRDHILPEASRAALRQALPKAEVWTLPNAGHNLEVPDLVDQVLSWMGDGLL